jgi:hypothetical protein
MNRVRAAALAAAGALLVAAGPATAASPGVTPERRAVSVKVPKGHCVPPTGVYNSTRVLRTRTSKATEVTELFGNGAYRVTKCDRKGKLRRSQTVARMKIPNGGRANVIITSSKRSGKHLINEEPLYAAPDNAQEASVFSREMTAGLLTKTKAKSVTVSRKRSARGGLRAADHGDDCHDPSFTYFGAWPTGVENYFIAVTTLPPGFTTDAAAQVFFADRIRNGHDVWNTRFSGCGFEPRIDRWQATFAGYTTSRAGGGPSDNQSVQDGDFGPFCGSDSVLACTWTYPLLNQPGTINEADVRFNLSQPDWYWGGPNPAGADPPPGHLYDAFSVAAHESGHEMGCGHVPGSPSLTMYPFISRGSDAFRTPGLGDFNCLTTLYDP